MVDSLIRLYSPDTNDFSSNGLGVLSDATSCIVKEELNEGFTLEMQYPFTGIHYSDIAVGCIITAKSNPYSDYQPFRIINISRPIKGIVSITANHLAYDLADYPIIRFDNNYPLTTCGKSGYGYNGALNAEDTLYVLTHACKEAYVKSYTDSSSFPTVGEEFKVYYDVNQNKYYKFLISDAAYHEISSNEVFPFNIDVFEISEDYPADPLPGKVSVAKAYLYQSADQTSTVLVELNRNYSLNVYNQSSTADFYKVSYNGTIGYVKRSYVEITYNVDDILGKFAQLEMTTPTNYRSLIGNRVDEENKWKQPSAIFSNFLENFGGEIEYSYDNTNHKTNIIFNYKRGVGLNEKTLTIRYGKNMTDMKHTLDYSKMYTHIYPYYGNGDKIKELIEDSTTGIPNRLVPVTTVRHPWLKNIKVLPLDLSNEFYDSTGNQIEPEQDALYERTKHYISKNFVTLTSPKMALTVSFVQLSDSPEYEQFKIFETAKIGNNVTVEFAEIGTFLTARIVATQYDVILGRYKSVDVGEVHQSLARTLSSHANNTRNNSEDNKKTNSAAIEAIQNVYYLSTAEPIHQTPFPPYKKGKEKDRKVEWITQASDVTDEWTITIPSVPETLTKYLKKVQSISNFIYNLAPYNNDAWSTWIDSIEDNIHLVTLTCRGNMQNLWEDDNGNYYSKSDLQQLGLTYSGTPEQGDIIRSYWVGCGTRYYTCVQKQLVNGNTTVSDVTDMASMNEGIIATQTIYIASEKSGEEETPLSPTLPEEWITETEPSGGFVPETWYCVAIDVNQESVKSLYFWSAEQIKTRDGTVITDHLQRLYQKQDSSAVQDIYYKTTESGVPDLPTEWITNTTQNPNMWYTTTNVQTTEAGYYKWHAKQYKRSDESVYCDGAELVTAILADIQYIYCKSSSVDTVPNTPTTWVTETSSDVTYGTWTKAVLLCSSGIVVFSTYQKKIIDGSTVSYVCGTPEHTENGIKRSHPLRCHCDTTIASYPTLPTSWTDSTSTSVNTWSTVQFDPNNSSQSIANIDSHRIYEIEQIEEIIGGSIRYVPTTPVELYFKHTKQQVIYWITTDEASMPTAPTSWVTETSPSPSSPYTPRWFNSAANIDKTHPTSSSSSWKDYTIYSAIQTGEYDLVHSVMTLLSTTTVEEIMFNTEKGLVYNEVVSTTETEPSAPSAPSSYSDIHLMTSGNPTYGWWYTDIPERASKTTYKVIKFYSCGYEYGYNALGCSFFSTNGLKTRDIDNMTVQWCAANDVTKIEGSSIWTKTLDAQKVTVWRKIDGVDKLLFRADGTSDNEEDHKVEIGNYVVNPETGGLVGTWENAQNTSGIEMYDKANSSKAKTIMTPYKFKVGYMDGQTFVDEARLDMDSLVFEQTLAGVYCNGGILELGGNAVRLAAKFFPGSSVIYSSKPEWTSDDVGRVIFVKEQNS